jgi:NhaP-type Na+/H+ or K+/H+ antiporter
LIGRFILYLRTRHREAVGLDEFLTLGLIALAYGLALLIHSYGFLAVFAAGLALRRIERQAAEEQGQPPDDVKSAAATGRDEEIASDPHQAPAYMAETALAFNEKAEHIGEFIVMLFVGAVLAPYLLEWSQWWLIALLFLVVRPLAVLGGLAGTRTTRLQRGLIAWFGIRGLGSIYYLSYAIQHGLPFEISEPLTAIVLTTVAASIIVHGFSVTPLMHYYRQRVKQV